MIDLHCHILPGIDDGPRTWEESLQMARVAYQDGITTIVATPHIDDGIYEVQRSQILDRTYEFSSLLKKGNINIKVLPGASIHIQEGLVEGLKNGDLMTLNDTGKYVLLELPHECVPDITDLIFRLQIAGIKPIIAHPERNLEIQQSPYILDGLSERGCLFQTTAASFLGDFGPRAKKCAKDLLRQGDGMLFVATDAHSATKRPPKLSAALKKMVNMSFYYIDALAFVLEYPQAVIEGKEIRRNEEAIVRNTY